MSAPAFQEQSASHCRSSRNPTACLDGQGQRTPADTTLLLSFGVQRVGWERLSAPFRLHALQVPEDGARVDPQILRRLGAVAAVPLEHLVDVALLPFVACLRERQDGI